LSDGGQVAGADSMLRPLVMQERDED